MGPNPLFMLLSLVVIACLVVVLCAPRTAEAVVAGAFADTRAKQRFAPQSNSDLLRRSKKKVRWADDVVFNGT
jgi:hypothetical protein